MWREGSRKSEKCRPPGAEGCGVFDKAAWRFLSLAEMPSLFLSNAGVGRALTIVGVTFLSISATVSPFGLGQGSENIFCKGPVGIYFRYFGTDSLLQPHTSALVLTKPDTVKAESGCSPGRPW